MPRRCHAPRCSTRAVVLTDGDIDTPARRRELDRVGEQVPDHLLQSGWRRRRIAPAAGVEPQAQARSALASAAGRIDSSAASTAAAGSIGAYLEPQLAREDPRDVEQILDESRLQVRVALDDLERVRLALRRQPHRA